MSVETSALFFLREWGIIRNSEFGIRNSECGMIDLAERCAARCFMLCGLVVPLGEVARSAERGWGPRNNTRGEIQRTVLFFRYKSQSLLIL